MATHLLSKDALFLGFDCSTQSLKVTVVDSELCIVASNNVHFDSELPHYKTKDGVHRGPAGSGKVTAPTLMWAEALEILLSKLLKTGFPFARVKAISGSGQQHGSVYWKKGALETTLKRLDPKEPLSLQLRDVFSTPDSPVWMDSSTAEQCQAIEREVGGPTALAALTGSRAYERFTGPQIRNMFETHKSVYDSTERISLVSSFMASLLVGDYVAIDHSDGAGMNLMDLKERKWSQIALQGTAPALEEKLGPLAAPHEIAGTLNSFFVDRYGFASDCLVVHWSGDNPNSLVGLALNQPGDLGISLGTSDTVFGITMEPNPGLEGHIFPNPVDPRCYMLMLCYKNGSLAREEVRDRCADGSWQKFNFLLSQTMPLNDGKVGFYYKDPEILPPLPAGVHRYKLLNIDDGTPGHAEINEVAEFDSMSEVRAIVEGQFLSMRAHSERRGMPSPPERVIATGGASANRELLKLIANVFGCPVFTTERPDSASLGAAVRAVHGWLCHRNGDFVPISHVYKDEAGESTVQLQIVAPAGEKEVHLKYGILAAKRVDIELQMLQNLATTQQS